MAHNTDTHIQEHSLGLKCVLKRLVQRRQRRRCKTVAAAAGRIRDGRGTKEGDSTVSNVCGPTAQVGDRGWRGTLAAGAGYGAGSADRVCGARRAWAATGGIWWAKESRGARGNGGYWRETGRRCALAWCRTLRRADAFIGDNRNFQEDLYDMDLLSLKEFGDDGPDGNNTVFNVQTLIAMKIQNIKSDQAANPKVGLSGTTFQFTDSASVRLSGSSYERILWPKRISLDLLIMKSSGTTGKATLPIISSFFRDQRLPENWFRPATQIISATNGPIVVELLAGVGVAPGRNNEHGVYVADPTPPPPFNVSLGCFAYWDQARNTTGVLANTTGLFKENVDLLEGFVFAASGCAEQLPPSGPTGV
ncbi:hypothetical protein B0H19DRAFT_1082384 [Mycena capillaripes]|nr:hypothetical protein B0H19DRAFT_1082384 [Mycena capillaripes]